MYNFIIPIHNERENILTLIKMIESTMTGIKRDFIIIIVDDGSSDGTYDLLMKNKQEYIRLIYRTEKMGLGSAYKAAIQYCTHPFTFILDADLSHDPLYCQDMILEQKKYESDIVIGSRYIKNGGVYGWSLYRKLVSRGANNFASFLLNLKSTDLTGSFRLYKTPILSSLLEKTSARGYSVQMELLYHAERMNYSISELPIVFYERIFGVSKLNKGEIFNFVKSVLKLFLN
jgi:dolichol-phosphate mannosyltransferase